MLDLPYSLVIEATEEPDFFGFYSPELEGFSGVGHSVEDCLYQARWAMKEHVELLAEQQLPVPPLDLPDLSHLPDIGAGESICHSELRAAAVEVRFLEGFLRMVERSAEESGLDADEEALARFAGRMARKVGKLAERIEEKL